MKLVTHIACSSALLVAASASCAQEESRRMCSDEIREVVTAALRYAVADVAQNYAPHRIDPKSPVIADYGILEREGMIYVRSYLDEPACTIDESDLPRSTTAALVRVDDDELRRLAQRNGEALAYVRALEVRFIEGTAGVDLGVALQPVPGDTRGLVCCCGGEMVLRRDAGQWRFVEWRNVFCA